MALVLRILDEIPRSPIRRPVTWYVFSKRPQMSVSTIDSEEPILEHRRLRFSFQINDFKDREPPERPDRLAPGCGGGGDVVASGVGVKRSEENFFTGPPSEPREARGRRERRL